MIRRQGLHIVNSSEKCKGTITRERCFENFVEQSVLDYVVVCPKMFCYLAGMTVDEERAYVLSSYDKKQGVIKSDHNMI